MNQDLADHTLTPNLSRAFVRVLVIVALCIAAAAAFERYHSGQWWSIDYFVSLLIPLLLLPAFVCLLFVPRRIQWSSMEFRIEPRFGPAQALPWTQLYAYGSGNNVLLLQFSGVSTFQIFPGAFVPADWKAFRSFLTANHPDKKTFFWLGPKAIRWKLNT